MRERDGDGGLGVIYAMCEESDALKSLVYKRINRRRVENDDEDE
jgi:hypothetical protein